MVAGFGRVVRLRERAVARLPVDNQSWVDELPSGERSRETSSNLAVGGHRLESSYLVDPASSHMLVSKIKPCMSKYKQVCTVKLRMAH